MSWSRREFLTASLGAVVAASACRCRAPEPKFGGRLLGPNHEAGHLLREAFERPVTKRSKVGVAILGAGPSGLSAAWRLAHAKQTDVAVFELETQPGGTSASTSTQPWGAHYVPVPSVENRSLVRLLREVGAIESISDDGEVIGAEHVLCRAPQERLFHRNTWFEGLYPKSGALPDDLSELAAFDAEVKRHALRRDASGRPVFAFPTARCALDEESLALDRLSMAAWMDAKGWRSKRLRWFVDYACRDDFGLRLEETSAWAGLLYFAGRLDNPRHEPAEFLTWPEGNGHLVSHLAKSVPSLRTGTLVCGLTPREHSVELRVLHVATGEVELVEAERVISAIPKFVLTRLLPSLATRFPKEPFGSWIVANVKLRDRPASRGFPLAWDNVIYDSESLGYVDATHQTGRDHGPTTWTWYLPLTGKPADVREELLSAKWDRWSDAVVADLSRAHEGLLPLIDSIDVWRWGHAMPRPVPGFLREGRRLERPEPEGRLHFAHMDLSGVALIEESHFHGVRAAEEVLKARGVPFETFL